MSETPDGRDEIMNEFFATTSSAANYDAALETVKAIQRKVAVSALPASALRGQQTPGLIRMARDFFATVPLDRFGVAWTIASRLDALTNDLLVAFPKKARRWGVARKSVNLFLRDAYYNFLRRSTICRGRQSHMSFRWTRTPRARCTSTTTSGTCQNGWGSDISQLRIMQSTRKPRSTCRLSMDASASTSTRTFGLARGEA